MMKKLLIVLALILLSLNAFAQANSSYNYHMVTDNATYVISMDDVVSAMIWDGNRIEVFFKADKEPMWIVLKNKEEAVALLKEIISKMQTLKYNFPNDKANR
jgi:hypothetical protein